MKPDHSLGRRPSHTSIAGRRPYSLAARIFALCALASLVLKSWLYYSSAASIWSPFKVTPAGTDQNGATGILARPWQDKGQGENASYWFDSFHGTLAVMQTTYWNGSSWPASIQWVSAFLDTLVAASDRSLLSAIQSSDQNETGSLARREIDLYFSEIEAFFDDEDTIQIFGAAYDDAQWVVLEWLEVIKLVRQYDVYFNSSLGQYDIARFAHRAHIFYNIVQNQFDTSLCDGGITWNPALETYKNAITNELFIASSISMYLYFPGDNSTDPYPSPDYFAETNITLPLLPVVYPHATLFLENAIKGYAWFRTHNFTNDQGLIIDGFHLTHNQTTCNDRNEMVYTYNQGVILSGLRGLWDATGNVSYLADGYALISTLINATGWNTNTTAEAAQWSGMGRNGIIEDYCDAPANCSQDAQIFKGIYFQHLGLFCEPLPTSEPLIPGVSKLAVKNLAALHNTICQSYLPWIERNAHAALETRNASRIIGGWWGASYLNHTQTAAPYWTASLPVGSWDVRNHLGLLSQPLWRCRGQPEPCQSARGMRSILAKRRQSLNQRRDTNDLGRGRTVETQGSGLSVVRAANDFALRHL